ncbi:MAG TPA: cupin-like domain-containing protein [Sphingomonadaceae bacterium]|nr:cupin-like domain-containing protein [Sphingomonadaceae bacterium]
MSDLPPACPIPEIAGITRERFENEVRPAEKPVVFRGLARDWPGVQAALKGDGEICDYLVSFHPTRPVTGLMSPPEVEGRFFYNDQLTGFNFTKHKGRLEAFLGELLRISGAEGPPGMAVQSEIIPELLPGFVEANPMPLVPDYIEPRIWLGNRIRVAPHYDLMENIAVCLAGRRRFTLFPPEQLANLYAGPFELTPAGTPVSMVDPLEPDLERYPRFAEAWSAAQQVTLAPGDALYIPYTWWHGVEALEPVSILVNYWWNEAPPDIAGQYDALLHAIFAFRHLPERERKVWRTILDHYVFDMNGDPAGHLPDHAKGIMGPADPKLFARMRHMLAQIYR